MKECNNKLIEDVMSAAYRVRQNFGPGLLESIYEFALVDELQKMGIHAERKESLPARNEKSIGSRTAVMVENSLLLALKCVDRFTSKHAEQLASYLRNQRFRQGLLLNFNSTLIRRGVCQVTV
jgi:GxxExxY protein